MSYIIDLLKTVKELLNKFRKNIAQRSKLYWIRKEYNMVDLYVALIISGRRSFDQVPSRYKDAVRADLLALGLDENGDPLQD